MFDDAGSVLFTASTLVLIVISLLFTMLLIRSKPSTANKRLAKEGKKLKLMAKTETKQKTKTRKATEAPEILKSPKNEEVTETRNRPKVSSPVKGCLHYPGYLEKLSTSSFPYECLACSKLGACMGDKKKLEKVGGNMSEYTVAKRIESTIEKSNKAPWRAWRGKNEEAVPGKQVPELYELLKELGGKIKHNDWEYQCYEKPLNIVVRTKS